MELLFAWRNKEQNKKYKKTERSALFRKRIKCANNRQGGPQEEQGLEKKQMLMEVAIKFRDKGKYVNLNVDTVNKVAVVCFFI